MLEPKACESAHQVELRWPAIAGLQREEAGAALRQRDHPGLHPLMNGIVERRNQRARVTVNVDMLGQSVSVELDLGEVEVED